MSGRKKNRKHRHGQPPHELLNELNSLRDLLGSDMEADIPLLDQVAEPGAGKETPSKAPPAPPRQPIAPPRPLQEADLPILFSPVDEEPFEEYTPLLSEADRELLRPLQNLPRREPAPTMEAEKKPEPQVEKQPGQEPNEQPAKQPEQEPTAEQQSLREEFQPGLFDAPAKSAPGGAPESAAPKAKDATKPQQKTVMEEKAPQKPLPAALSENPFLPPHIRARLTGGRIPRPQEDTGDRNKAEPAPKQEPAAAIDADDVAASPPDGEARSVARDRERLIEQLMAEQLPELERQLRANITLMVNEIYPEDS